MYSPVFTLLNASPQVKLILGNSPLRVYPSGRAPQNSVKPYAVYSVYNANPENYLDSVPDIDNKGTQINIYAETADSCKKAFDVIRDTLEPHAHMTNFSTDDVDAETDLFSARLEFDFWDER